ncbi:hypothetical protein LV457_09110 [Mycobacterium sp. MYCO198283]|uniref:hypothetical protein n=1 Tax=Mycobacterium sp. MYCO198283 TaxID=2883505 RepID=UPI001E64CEC1|nr:hypothetical protein [Mycobacterium sp. MYCO198283]MCG5432450.1 hypothetical protein [Mycobacterium sp. MYCO198283]
MAAVERGLLPADAAQRDDLARFVERALRLDEAAVIRLRRRSDTAVVAWTATGFDVLASRVVLGAVRPGDLCAGADALARGLAAARGVRLWIDTGFPMDSAWRSALPPDTGFVHLDDVPAGAVHALAEQGAALAKEHTGAHGPPVSLLDQEVMHVSGADDEVGIPMRCVFALTAMGFLPPGDEIVRVRVTPAWLRIDARFGSVYRRRGGPLLLS